MTTPTFNKFKSTTIFGAFNNTDYPDNTLQASAFFQRALTCSGNITCSGIIYGKDGTFSGTLNAITPATANNSTRVATTAFVKAQDYATTVAPTFTIGINIANFDPFYVDAPLNASIGNSAGILYINTLNGGYPIQLNASNVQLSKNNGANYYDVLTSNTGALLSGATFTGALNAITQAVGNNSTLVATTAYVKSQGYLTSASLSNYALLSGATFTGALNAITPGTANNSTLVATTAYVKSQGYLTSASLSNYALLSGATFTGALNAITTATANNSTLVATTAYVKSQGYLTSASLSNHALLNGTNNWSGVNNFNVNVGALSNSFATGLSVCQNISNGEYETDFIANNGNNGGGFRFYDSSNGTISTTPLFEISSSAPPLFEISSSAPNSMVGSFTLKQRYSTSSVVLSFSSVEGYAKGFIFSSVQDNSFHFDLMSAYNPNGFVWRIGDTNTTLMTLDLTGKLTVTGLVNGVTPSTADNSNTLATTAFVKSQNYVSASATPVVNLHTITTTELLTADDGAGNVWSSYCSSTCKIRASFINGTVIVSLYQSNNTGTNLITYKLINYKPSGGSAVATNILVLGTIVNQNANIDPSAPAPTAPVFASANVYDNTGTLIKGYVTLLKRTNTYGSPSWTVCFVATGGYTFPLNTNTNFSVQNFSFTYN